MNLGIYIGCSIGAVAGNFLYQSFCMHPNWDAAVDRAVFMTLGVVVVFLAELASAVNR